MYNFETDIEMLQTLPWAAGRVISIPCYHPGASIARFWLAKSNQQLIRMEQRAPDGVLHRKTLLY